ncbi:MAG TPA: thioredoxin domain-containing protein [Chitinophagales bacterium]
MHKYTNELINETSPYLLQHAQNPVNWMAWSEKSLARAQAENKLLIVSIGYSACHWCHVMERESFENEAVARVMNEHFISIKVDREERPDVDMIYMDAAQLITGHGGWPLNAICLPNGKPIYAGTYFRPEQWVQVLQFLVNEFRNEPEKTAQRADEITEHIQAMNVVPLLSESVFLKDSLPTSWAKYKQTWDFEFGGRKGAPKFPMPSNLKYLLDLYSTTQNEEILNALTATLDGMILGGIFDHAGGGFARYSVDEFWHIPHFEKMLYDNAQLLEVYALVYQLTKKHEYKTVVYRTTEFLLRELRDESGIFYSALDADSEGEEGKFYVWTKRELQDLLQEDFAEFEKRFQISEEGNFEHATNHLVRKTMDGFGSEQEFRWMNLLLRERSKRIRPNLDDKSLLSWNALLLAGFATAYRVFDDELFLENARALEKVLREKMIAKDLSADRQDGSLYRSYKKGKSTIPAFLEDYSLLSLAYIKLYEATFDETFLAQANRWTDYAVQHFYNPQNGMFFFSAVDADEQLISRKTETSDNVIPSSNAVMATVLHYLGEVFENAFYQKTALQMMKNIQPLAEQHPYFYSLWASLQLRYIFPPAQIAIVGDGFWKLKKETEEFFLPNVFLLGVKNESSIPLLQNKHKADETLIYVCRNGYCALPVKSVSEAMKEVG